MISRRQMIGSGAALSALTLSPRMVTAVETPARVAARVAVVVVDERFDAAHLLANVHAPDARRITMPRDVLDLWYRHLAPISRSGQQAIAGVTTERGFFLLRTLAADHRLRVLSRTEHGALVSWVIGPK